jgi:hypothetical protein
MRRLLALLLIFAMLVLSSCELVIGTNGIYFNKGDKTTTTTTTTTTTVTTTTAAETTTAVTSVTTTQPPVADLTGDVNCDDSVNVADIILLNKYLLGMENLTDEQFVKADITGDKKVNIFDLVILKRILIKQ